MGGAELGGRAGVEDDDAVLLRGLHIVRLQRGDFGQLLQWTRSRAIDLDIESEIAGTVGKLGRQQLLGRINVLFAALISWNLWALILASV